MSRLLPTVLLLLACLPAGPARAADSLHLALPVDCHPGRDCFVQNYVDTDPGPGARDFTCGRLTYDGHQGTDIRLVDRAAMRRGVAVLAAAPGRVTALRDGEPDLGRGDVKATGPGSRACGNGVWIEHGGGWSTQYCHMKRGSVAVRRGQTVATGQRLGEIGLSGRTEFPHLHLTVRHDRIVIDPFTALAIGTGCGASHGGRPLWTEAAARALGYRASGLLRAGFAERVPKRAEVEDGAFGADALADTAPVLVFWVEIFGLRRGDVEVLRFRDGAGRTLAEHRSKPAARDQAVRYVYIGRRRGARPWPDGTYVGEFRLLRGTAAALAVERRLTVR